MMRRFGPALFCILALGAATAHAGDFVVVAATNTDPSLKAGATVTSGQSLTLSSDARATLLSRSGKVIRLKGPYNGPIESTAGSGGSLSAVTALLVNDQAPSRRIGATRGAGLTLGAASASSLADPWIIDASRSGVACARATGATLWRRNATSTAGIIIAVEDGRRHSIVWPARQHRVTIEADRLSGARSLEVTDGRTKAAVAMHVEPAESGAIASPGMALHWMAAKGCKGQAMRLIRKLHGRDG
jgi:hypothetical protein